MTALNPNPGSESVRSRRELVMNVLSHFSSYLDTFPAALAAPEPEGGGEGDLLFVRTQTERGKGREKREERREEHDFV